MAVLIKTRKVATGAGETVLAAICGSGGRFIELSALGAGITRLVMPDGRGRLADIALGYADYGDYMSDGPCAGKTPGRFAGRIAGARFMLDGKEVVLTANDGANALHGGPGGFMNRIWDVSVIDGGVRFSRISPHGEEGYPGNLSVAVSYIWNDNTNELTIDFEAETDAPTVVNLTNHVYFNLAGHSSGSCLNHRLTVDCPLWLPVGTDDIPLPGEPCHVGGTPFDFRVPKALGRDIGKDFSTLRAGKGYNHYYMFADGNAERALRRVASLADDAAGRRVDIFSTSPGAMLYTGNWLSGSPLCKGDAEGESRPYADHDGVAIECQLPPDAPNRPGFPSARLNPGECYRHRIVYRFIAF